MKKVYAFIKKRGTVLFEIALLIALTVCVVLYAQSRLFPPEREELLTVSGICRSTEYSRISLEHNGEPLGSYKLDEKIEPKAAQLLRSIKLGDEIELLYIDDTDRTVMELTVNGETLLTYDRASAMWNQNTVWTVGTILLAVVGALLALGGVVAVVYWENRRKAARERDAAEKRERAKTEKKAAEYCEALAGVRYTAEERQGIESYIADAFGSVSRVYYELDADVPRIDLAVCEPSEGRRLYTLTTVGMGAFRLCVPKELEERNQSFVELTMLVPEDWDFEQSWPLTMLKEVAHHITDEYEETAPQAGNAYYCSAAVREASGFAAVLVVPASVRDGNSPRVMVPGGKIVNFYLLVPLYEEEWNYIFVRGSSWQLWKRMGARGFGAFVQPERECCVDPDTWLDEDLEPFYFGENAARGEYYLGLSDFTYFADRFANCGLEPSGTLWERIACECLWETEWRDADEIEFSSTEEMLFIESENETLLRDFALRLRDLCEDEAAFMEILERSKEENDGT